MKSAARRAALTMVAAALALPAVAVAKHPIAGIVPDLGHHTAGARIADAGNLPYGGGPVLHWNRTHLIFWNPAGSGMSFEPGYESLIESFLANVAAASRSATNVYGLTGQYSDRNGPAAYASSYGGAVIDNDRLPSNGCTEPPATGPGWSVCLTDEQLQREIEHVVRLDRLPTGPTDLYFLVTPNGVGDCAYATSNSCALGGDVSGYCGYHSQTNDGMVLYAVIPYNAVPGHCQSDNPRPNSNAADPTISTISHEHSEMITDPLGNGWIDPATGNETGDLCLTSFGPSIGGSGNAPWNQNINGGHYYLQDEWSNRDGGCTARALPDTASFRVGAGSSRGLPVWFWGRAADPQGRIVSYRWWFGDGRRGAGHAILHRFARTGSYRVVLRVIDSWGNAASYAATVTVSRTNGRPALETKSGWATSR